MTSPWLCEGGAGFEVPDGFPPSRPIRLASAVSGPKESLSAALVFLTARLDKMNLLDSFMKFSGFSAFSVCKQD